MYYYGNGGTCCPNQTTSYYYPVGNCNRNNYAIVLVLFISTSLKYDFGDENEITCYNSWK